MKFIKAVVDFNAYFVSSVFPR